MLPQKRIEKVDYINPMDLGALYAHEPKYLSVLGVWLVNICINTFCYFAIFQGLCLSCCIKMVIVFVDQTPYHFSSLSITLCCNKNNKEHCMACVIYLYFYFIKFSETHHALLVTVDRKKS